MYDPKTLLLTDDAMEAIKISRWLDSWGYCVKTLGFGNEAIFDEDLLTHNLILIDPAIKDINNCRNVFEAVKNGLSVPVVCLASKWDYKVLDFPETISCIEKPVDPKELKLTLEMAIYKH